MKFVLDITMPHEEPYTFEEIRRAIDGSLEAYVGRFPDAVPEVGNKAGVYEPGLPGVPMMSQRLLQIGQWRVGPKEPSPWVEWTCLAESYDYSVEPATLRWKCGTRFKFIRGAPPYCPKCGALQFVDGADHWDKMVGIEIEP